jgi:branched-chain amino acid aminotransferase
MELAKSEGIAVREADISPPALIGASESFLTGTTAGVWPVESVDRQALGSCPGPVSVSLQARFKRVVRGDDPDFAHWLTPAGD